LTQFSKKIIKMLKLLVEFRANSKQIAEVLVMYFLIYSLRIRICMNVVLVIPLLSILIAVVFINFRSVMALMTYALNAAFHEIIFS